MLMPRFEDGTSAVNKATARGGGSFVMRTLQFVEQTKEPRRCVPCVAGEIKRVDVAVEMCRKFGLLQKHGMVVLPQHAVRRHVLRVPATGRSMCTHVFVCMFSYFFNDTILSFHKKASVSAICHDEPTPMSAVHQACVGVGLQSPKL